MAGRPRKSSQIGAGGDRFFASEAERRVAQAVDPTTQLPRPLLANGNPNIEFYRHLYRKVVEKIGESIVSGDPKLGFNLKDAMAAIIQSAQLDRFTEKDVVDTRSEADKGHEAAMALIESPDTVHEQTDESLQFLQSNMERVVDMLENEIAKVQPTTRQLGGMALAEKLDRGKAWVNRFQTVLRLREWVRSPVPSKVVTIHRSESAWRASRVLRYMLYVQRSGITNRSTGITKSYMKLGEIHASFAMTYWCARDRVAFCAPEGDDGKLKPFGPYRGMARYDGCVIIAPPGHGKTSFAHACTAIEIFDHDDTQGAYLHNTVPNAIENVEMVKKNFDLSTPNGRRARAVFPDLELADRDNINGKMRVRSDRALKSPTLVAAGSSTDRQGSDTNFQVRDDIVPRSDAVEETTREDRKKQLAGVWDLRQRGGYEDHFTLNIGTIWHEQDALCSMVRACTSGKSSYLLCVVKVEGKYPRFKAPWSEVLPPSELNSLYEKMNDPALWSAAYQADPRADELRFIKKLRFYDYDDKDRLAMFVEQGEGYMSLDPAATNKRGNDKAALVYGVVGEVLHVVDENTVEYRTKLRIVDATQFYNNPAELVEKIGVYATSHKTDHVLIESKTGFVAVAQWTNEKYGIECVCVDPGDKNKGYRLKQCAMLVDASVKDSGGQEAVVEFPGRRNPETGDLECHPDFVWFARQFLDFGTAGNEDHALDAGTQLINHLRHGGRINPMQGAVTQRAIVAQHLDPSQRRVAAMLESFERAAPKGANAHEQDARFLMESA